MNTSDAERGSNWTYWNQRRDHLRNQLHSFFSFSFNPEALQYVYNLLTHQCSRSIAACTKNRSATASKPQKNIDYLAILQYSASNPQKLRKTRCLITPEHPDDIGPSAGRCLCHNIKTAQELPEKCGKELTSKFFRSRSDSAYGTCCHEGV